jgi:hypothetical protein
MLIEIRKQTTLAGLVVRVGEVHEASLSDANLLIGNGQAVEAQPLVCPPKLKPKRQRKPNNDNPQSGNKNNSVEPSGQ